MILENDPYEKNIRIPKLRSCYKKIPNVKCTTCAPSLNFSYVTVEPSETVSGHFICGYSNVLGGCFKTVQSCHN